MARRSRPFLRHRWRLGAAGGVGLALAAAAACGAPTVSGGKGTGADREQVIVCESGIQTHGDVRTSSAVVRRVPAGTAVPPGCRLG